MIWHRRFSMTTLRLLPSWGEDVQLFSLQSQFPPEPWYTSTSSSVWAHLQVQGWRESPFLLPTLIRDAAVNCNYRPTCGCPVWGGWRGWCQTEARAPPNGQTAALPGWPSCCGYAASTWKSIAWNKCEIMTDECRASCIRALVFHTSHWPLSPRSCSLDQMLWTLPACSGWRLLSPHVHWCFCIWASYTRPSTQTHRRFIPIGRRRHHHKMRLFMNGIETRGQFTPLVLCFPADEDKWVSPTGGKAQLAVCQRAGQWQWRQSGRRMWGGRHGGGRWGGLGPNQRLVS